MRHTLILIALLIPTLTFSQSVEQDKVNNTIKALFVGLSELSLEQVKKNATDDFMVLEAGELWNIDTIAAKINQIRSLKPARINAFKFIKTEINDNTAWVAYENRAVITINGEKNLKEWLESAFLVKQDNEWKVRMLHSTPISSKKN